MKNKISNSSEVYLVKCSDIRRLTKSMELSFLSDKEICIFLSNETDDKLVSGFNILEQYADEDYVPARFLYNKSCSSLMGLFIHLIKFIKRKLYKKGHNVYSISLDSLLSNNLLRGVRNRENAYRLTSKRWRLKPEQANKKYEELYQSIYKHGYDSNFPICVVLNRQLGVKDQLLQGHHRIGICKELNIKNVAVSFWTLPSSFNILRLFIRRSETP